MNASVLLMLFCGYLVTAEGIYLDNSTKVKIETNPAIWTEEGIWGPILEDWVTGNQRLVYILFFYVPAVIILNNSKCSNTG